MTKIDLLLDVVEDVTFFRDNNDKEIFYAEFENNEGKREFALLDSESFKSFLYVKSYEITEGKNELEPDKAVKKLRFFLLFQKCYRDTTVFVRTSGDLSHCIEYDLQNDTQKTVKVTPKGWKISPKRRKFIIPKIALPQVTPVQTSKTPLELLKPFINIRGDTYILFVVWLVQAFSRGMHHALLIFADKGSGKTVLSKIIKRILDPCNFKVTPIPDKKDDLHVLLYNSFLCCFDNVSNISDEVSDVFCGAITGTSIAKRSLYTNGELTVATLHNTIVINGIGVIPSKDDLAERMLFLKLKKLKKDELKLESVLWKKFDKALPEILGSIFNTLSKAMIEIKKIETEDLSRLTDSFFEMLAIAKSLGIGEEKFRQIYNDNVSELEKARSSSPLVEAIKEYMGTITSRKFQGKADKVLNKIRDNFSGDKTLLPNSASHFTRQAEKEHENLLKNGFRVNIDDTSATGTDVTIIRKK